jgi:hypothetical protein
MLESSLPSIGNLNFDVEKVSIKKVKPINSSRFMSLDATQNIGNSKIDYTTLIFDDNFDINMNRLKPIKGKVINQAKRSVSVKKNTFYQQ